MLDCFRLNQNFVQQYAYGYKSHYFIFYIKPKNRLWTLMVSQIWPVKMFGPSLDQETVISCMISITKKYDTSNIIFIYKKLTKFPFQ